MERIGIRELRQHASRYVRRARQGEAFEVTDRGEPVARLVPAVETPTGYERLKVLGLIRQATRDHRTLPPPSPLPPGARRPSEILVEMREQERS